jgi:hypothetical protein
MIQRNSQPGLDESIEDDALLDVKRSPARQDDETSLSIPPVHSEPIVTNKQIYIFFTSAIIFSVVLVVLNAPLPTFLMALVAPWQLAKHGPELLAQFRKDMSAN